MGLDNFVETITLEVLMHYSVRESFENGDPKLVYCDGFGTFGFSDRDSNGIPVLNDVADFPMLICKDTDDVIRVQGWMFEKRIKFPILTYIRHNQAFKMMYFI